MLTINLTVLYGYKIARAHVLCDGEKGCLCSIRYRLDCSICLFEIDIATLMSWKIESKLH